MIETTQNLLWALVVFTTSLNGNGEQVITHAAPSFHATATACDDAGQRLMSVIDTAPGVTIAFACVPRSVLREDLAMNHRDD